LSSAQRAAVAEALYGVATWRRRLTHHAGGDDPGLLLLCLLRDLAGLSDDQAVRLSSWEGPVPPRVAPPPDLGTRQSFPDDVVEVLRHAFGEEAEDAAAALNVPGPVFLRANTLAVGRDALSRRLAQEGVETELCRFSPVGLRVVSPRPNLLPLPSFREGLFEVQDEGSQLIGLLVGARPGETVVDCCAGAGGKTLHLGADMGNAGRLFAHDVDADKLRRLVQRTRKAGLGCVEVGYPSPGHADRVLVDAPCSEVGALRRGPDRRYRLALEGWPTLQGRILEEASLLVRPGGVLVYATCTWRQEENQDVVAGFLGRHAEFRREDARDRGLPDAVVRDGFLWTAPHRHGTDGFFAAALRRA
jgi:16S rRNA (cytosine967-C5)-methyltransferase